MGMAVANEVWAGSEVAELSTFDSAADFLERGIGFCVQDAGVTVGAAYSSLVCSTAIEVSVFVEQQRRKQGMATALSAALLLECLARGLHPNWDAANEASCRLAEKLGYVSTGSYLEHYLAG
jgi:L-amino acid N-acyltransferase YncA